MQVFMTRFRFRRLNCQRTHPRCELVTPHRYSVPIGLDPGQAIVQHHATQSCFCIGTVRTWLPCTPSAIRPAHNSSAASPNMPRRQP
jgi:hypothetical protein